MEHYKAPTLDEITHKLSGAKVISKLDAKEGFWSIHLDTPSSHLTTFNTHKGSLLVPLHTIWIKMVQDVFQIWMGKDITEHDNHLLELMKTAEEQGLVLNSSKCAIQQSQISFHGAVFTVQGMRPNPAKVQALQGLPATQNSKQLQSF